MSNQKRCCKNCKKDDLFDRCTILSENEEYKRLIQEVIDEECVEESNAQFFINHMFLQKTLYVRIIRVNI